MKTTLLNILVFAVVSASTVRADDNAYVQTILVANKPEFNPTIMVDEHVSNPWGISLRPPGSGGHIWISNAGDGSTTLYIGDANGVTLHQDGLRTIPIETVPEDPPGYSELIGQVYHATVTGQVYNAASDIPGQPPEFVVSGPAFDFSTSPATPIGPISGPAKFIFSTADGTINGWRSGTTAAMEKAIIIKDYTANSPTNLGLPNTPGLMGLAITTDAFKMINGNKVADNRLYAADFSNNRIMVFDNQWNDITSTHIFERPVGMPGDYMPFNVQYIDGRVYVAFAQTAYEIDDPTEELDLPGTGRIVAYDRDGHILLDFSDQSVVAAPWGMAMAPDNFGPFSNKLLVSNFGDGTIGVYDPLSGAALGQLNDTDGNPISIDGLWGITFGNGVSLGDSNALYFTAGPNGETDGLFGSIRFSAVPEPASLALLACVVPLLCGRRRGRR